MGKKVEQSVRDLSKFFCGQLASQDLKSGSEESHANNPKATGA